MPPNALVRLNDNWSPTVLICSPCTFTREGIRAMMTQIAPGSRAIEAATCDALLDRLSGGGLMALAVVDTATPRMSNGGQLSQLASTYGDTQFVIITSAPPSELEELSDHQNVLAKLAYDTDQRNVLLALQACLAGQRSCDFTAQSPIRPRLSKLTPRQLEVRDLLRQGLSNKGIARALGISEGTVKNHLSDIFRVLNSTNRTQAAQAFDGK